MNLQAPGALLLALTLCTLPARAAGPASASDLAAYADKLLSAVYPAGQPGAAVPWARTRPGRGPTSRCPGRGSRREEARPLHEP